MFGIEYLTIGGYLGDGYALCRDCGERRAGGTGTATLRLHNVSVPCGDPSPYNPYGLRPLRYGTEGRIESVLADGRLRVRFSLYGFSVSLTLSEDREQVERDQWADLDDGGCALTPYSVASLEESFADGGLSCDDCGAEIVEADEVCRECGEPVPYAGDGWDGLCPDCADEAEDAEEA